MSEMVEIHRQLQQIRDTTTRTARDVKWIKEGMERGTERMDGHDKDIAGLRGRQNYWAGGGTVIGAIFGFIGAVVAGHRI